MINKVMYSLMKRDKKLVDKKEIRIQNIFMQTVNFGGQTKQYKCRDTQGNQKVLSNFPPKKYSIKARSLTCLGNIPSKNKTISISGTPRDQRAQHMSVLNTKIDPYTEDQYLYQKKKSQAKAFKRSVRSKREETQQLFDFKDNPIKIEKIDVNHRQKELYIEMFYRSKGKQSTSKSKELEAILQSALEKRKMQSIGIARKRNTSESSKLKRKRPPRIGSAPCKVPQPTFQLATPTPWKILTPAIATPF